jgi:Aldo/keto reductases, related to diketogulonate reductase
MENPIVTFKNGQKVLALGQGTYRMGFRNKSEEIKALRAGIGWGMEVIDTAENYDNEEMVGEAIHGLRDRVFLVSKVQPGNASRQGTIISSCERSLRKLKTDNLDLYLLHWEGRSSFEETVLAMQKLRHDGKIKMWGVSNMDVRKMERFFAISGGDTCAANQVAYNVETRGTEFDLIPWCDQRNIVFMAYSPIGDGDLIRNKTLTGIGKRHNATAAQIALAWSVRLPNILSIPKASSVKHVEENFKSLSIQLTEEDFNDLDKVFPPPTRKMPFVGW